jgi:hypothetical protein
VDEAAIERARERLRRAVAGHGDPAAVTAALDRARSQMEAFAEATADLEASLPEKVGDAVRQGVRAEAAPVARQLAEVRGLAAQTIRRLERLETDLTGDRHSRIDDLALLVDLIASGWQSVDDRLARLERSLETSGGTNVYRIEKVRPTAETG